ncbi:MAG: murein biosynthesis integral membrane protein MurJ [Chloroflexi bacterium]|nr:murein biosynthesis integral membrane protein MurJ [Chloroflexota bacterium]
MSQPVHTPELHPSQTGANAHVARSALLVAALFGADKVLALVRDAVIGQTFGASASLDAYYAAFELPDGLFTIIAGSAMATTLIPILTGRIVRGERDEVWRLVSAVTNLALLLVAGVGAVGAVFAPQVIQAVAPGFDAAQVALAAQLMRLVLIQTLIFTASGIAMGALRAYQHFLLPALAPLCYTASRILGTLLLAPRWGIFGLAWGGLAGAVIYFLVLVPGLIRYGARWRPTLRHSDLRAVLALMGPRVMGLGATYLTFVLPTFFGSRLAAGAISSYEYAWRLMQFPETIIGTALGITVFPTLAELASSGERDGLRRTASWALRLLLALAVPAGVVLVLLGQPLTSLFLERGEFGADTTARVVWALQFLALGLVAHSALEVISRLFYAQRDMWTPFFAAVGGLIVNAGIGWLLLPSLTHGSMALANSLGASFQVVALTAVAHHRLGGVDGHNLALSLVRTLVASAVMGASVGGFLAAASETSVLVRGLGGLLVGGGAYLVAALLLGSEEIREFPRLLRREGVAAVVE